MGKHKGKILEPKALYSEMSSVTYLPGTSKAVRCKFREDGMMEMPNTFLELDELTVLFVIRNLKEVLVFNEMKGL